MFNITTKYDKIGDVRKKVFMIRGDEAYARTTDTVLTYSTPVTTSIKGFKTSLTATVHRNIGASKVDFYDGDTLLGQKTIGSGVSSVVLSDIYLSYGVPHDLYAVFKGNKQCLSSKSKKVELTVQLPPELGTVLAFTSIPTQKSYGSSFTVTVSATVNNESVPDSTPIKIYDNDEYVDTISTSSGSATITLNTDGEMSVGLHTIRAEVEESSTLHGATKDANISIGYNIQFYSYPVPLIYGANNDIKVKVTDWYDAPISGATVTEYESETQKTTDSNGIATFTHTTFSNNKLVVYYGCDGSYSEVKTLDGFTSTGVSATVSPTTIGSGELATVTINVGGSEYITGVIPAIINMGEYGTFTLPDVKTKNSFTYTGGGYGTINCTASSSNKSTTFTINDYLLYYTPTLKKNWKIIPESPNLIVGDSSYGYVMGRMGGASSSTFMLGVDNSGYEKGTLEVEIYYANISSEELSGGDFYLDDLLVGSPTLTSSGDVVKLHYENGTVSMYVNNTLISSKSYTTHGTWRIGIPQESDVVNPYIVVSKIKMYRS